MMYLEKIYSHVFTLSKSVLFKLGSLETQDLPHPVMTRNQFQKLHILCLYFGHRFSAFPLSYRLGSQAQVYISKTPITIKRSKRGMKRWTYGNECIHTQKYRESIIIIVFPQIHRLELTKGLGLDMHNYPYLEEFFTIKPQCSPLTS